MIKSGAVVLAGKENGQQQLEQISTHTLVAYLCSTVRGAKLDSMAKMETWQSPKYACPQLAGW